MKHMNSERTLVTLANAGELAVRIIQGVIGNEVADTYGGSPLTHGVIQNIAMTQFHNELSNRIGNN